MLKKILFVCALLALAVGAANAALLAEYTYGSNGLNNTGTVGAAANGTGVDGWAATANDGSATANSGGSTGWTSYMNVGGNASTSGWLTQISNQMTISLWSNINFMANGAGGGNWGTFAATGKPQSDSPSQGFFFGKRSSYKELLFTIVGTIPGYYGIQIAGAAADALPTDGSWHHYVATYDGTRARVYLDGVEIASASASGNVNLGSQDLWIGGNPYVKLVEGANWSLRAFTDDVRIYNNGLSAAQVLAQFQDGRSVLVPEPTTMALFGIGVLGLIRRKRA